EQAENARQRAPLPLPDAAVALQPIPRDVGAEDARDRRRAARLPPPPGDDARAAPGRTSAAGAAGPRNVVPARSVCKACTGLEWRADAQAVRGSAQRASQAGQASVALVRADGGHDPEAERNRPRALQREHRRLPRRDRRREGEIESETSSGLMMKRLVLPA